MYALKAEFEYLDRLFNIVLKNTKNFIHSFCLKLRVKPPKKVISDAHMYTKFESRKASFEKFN